MVIDNDILTKTLFVGESKFYVQFNKGRIRSSAAKTDAASIAKRPCFLCKENRPPEQPSKDWRSRYEILENPFPIFPKHLTIPTYKHIPQQIENRFTDMLALAADLPDFTVFFNGAHCGASAPDHMHFQAGSRHFMPIEQQWQECIGEHIAIEGQARLHIMENDPRNTLVMIADKVDDAVRLFERILLALEESMLNVLCYYENKQWFTFIFPRTRHRPSYFFIEGDKQMIISPASVDLGGVFITVRQEDFECLDATCLKNILKEVCWQVQEIKVFKDRLKGNDATR